MPEVNLYLTSKRWYNEELGRCPDVLKLDLLGKAWQSRAK